ncbi:hypothetical protein [Peptacetobacter sp. AB800]|uniref:hypothetical protein n=1 Tax=Peptacetobacter sp. AB800 TaxID=3388428 RepID=UPI0039FBB0F0
MDTNALRQLSMDLYHKRVVEFSEKEANDRLRTYIKDEICGGEWKPYTFLQHKYEIYEVMSELLTTTTAELSRDMFEHIAQFKDTELGDRIEFIVENPELYEVSVIASGTNDLLRQKLINGKAQTTGFDLGVKIYAEFNEFMTGRIDWDKCVEKVAKSFNVAIAELIAKEWKTAYDTVSSDLKVTGDIDENKLVELVQKVESQGQGKAIIYGSKTALAKIPNITTLEANAREDREKGYVSMFKGTECVELQNKYDLATKKWVLENDILFIVPSEVKPILIGFEGDAFVMDDETGERLDRQVEYEMTRKVHLGVLKNQVYGIYDYSV